MCIVSIVHINILHEFADIMVSKSGLHRFELWMLLTTNHKLNNIIKISYSLCFDAGIYENNGYVMVSSNGGLNQMRAGVSFWHWFNTFLASLMRAISHFPSFISLLYFFFLNCADMWHGYHCKIFKCYTHSSWAG